MNKYVLYKWKNVYVNVYISVYKNVARMRRFEWMYFTTYMHPHIKADVTNDICQCITNYEFNIIFISNL